MAQPPFWFWCVVGLDASVDEAGEGVGWDDTSGGVFGVEAGGGFGCDGFFNGLALFFESGDVVADGDEHLVVGGELGFVAHGAVAGDEDGLVVGAGEGEGGGGDHAVNVASGGVVDEGIDAVEPGVTGVDDVGVGEVDGDVGVGVGGVEVGEVEGFAVGGDGFVLVEDDGGESAGGCRGEVGVEGGDLLGGAEALAGVFVGDDGGAGGVEPLVAVGVVEVPVGVDEVLDGVVGDGGEGLGDLGAGGGEAGVYEELAVGAGEDEDVAAGAHEDADVSAELLGGDFGGGTAGAHLGDGVAGLGEEGAGGEVCGSGDGGRGGEEAATRECGGGDGHRVLGGDDGCEKRPAEIAHRGWGRFSSCMRFSWGCWGCNSFERVGGFGEVRLMQ